MQRSLVLIALVAGLASCASEQGPATANKAGERTLQFTYEATLADAPQGAGRLEAWIPAPQTIPGIQTVISESITVPSRPDATITSHESGPNRWWHVSVPHPAPGTTIRATIVAWRKEQVAPSFRGAGAKPLSDAEKTALAVELGANEFVPTSGRLASMASDVAGTETNSLNVARRLYDHVLGRMRYSKDGTGWGRGDSEWACDSGFGNCTDFHSLFMSLSRSRGIPARFHMGFPIPPERGSGKVGGYHCWAEFYLPDRGWVPVDISEADKDPAMAEYYFGNLTEDRLGFTSGRDLDLTPRPAAGRLNFFIYPHAELDGKAVTLTRAFAYGDR